MRLDTTQHEEKNCRNLAIVQSDMHEGKNTGLTGLLKLVPLEFQVLTSIGIKYILKITNQTR